MNDLKDKAKDKIDATAEAGKKAAGVVLDLQHKVHAAISSHGKDAAAIAQAIGMPEQVETIHHLLQHLSANGRA